MGILKDQKGQFNMMINAVIGLVILSLLLVFTLPMLNALTSSIIGGNMTSFSMSSTIVLIVQMFGVLAVAIGAMAWLTGVFNPQPQGNIGGM